MIWATPCDGIVECFEDWDEWYCDIDWIMYTAIGKNRGAYEIIKFDYEQSLAEFKNH